MSDVILISYLIIPFFYLLLISTTKREGFGVVNFNLWGGLVILVVYMLTLIFVESNDKPLYLESYLDAEDYYGEYDRELFWGKLQIFLSSFLMKNEILYWLFYSFFYCIAYYFVAKKYFPYQYAGYFVLCVVGCMGFVSYGSNTIRAGFGIALLLIAFCSHNRIVKACLSIAAVSCHLTMILPVTGYLVASYIVRHSRWCDIIWMICLVITSLTSILTDIIMLFGGLDDRIGDMANDEGVNSEYNMSFRFDFVVYSLVPAIFAKYNMKYMKEESVIYSKIYRMYVLNNAAWLLLMRIPYTDRVAYLSWFMIPFLLMYPVLNGILEIQHPQRYILRAITLFLFVNVVLMLR